MTAFFNESYRGTPPWDIGRPQTEFVRLVEEGSITGSVLDVGCVTGENALFFAERGLEAWGVDSASLAIEKAKQKARMRKSTARFMVWDALDLSGLGKRFDSVTDSGLFHVFSDEERLLFAKSLKSVLKEDGSYFMLCFSEKEPAEWGGPRRVTRGEITSTFKDGWNVNWIREARFESNFHEFGGHAWLSSITPKNSLR